MRSRTLSLALAAAVLAAATATTAAAQQQPAPPPAGHGQHGQHGAGERVAKDGHGSDHAASGWKEMDAFHRFMMETWHPASSGNDLRPIRAKAGAMADAARAWAAAAVPKACDTPQTRETVARVATESRALADLVARPAATDAEIKSALKALHDRFEVVEHGCTPGGHGGMKH